MDVDLTVSQKYSDAEISDAVDDVLERMDCDLDNQTAKTVLQQITNGQSNVLAIAQSLNLQPGLLATFIASANRTLAEAQKNEAKTKHKSGSTPGSKTPVSTKIQARRSATNTSSTPRFKRVSPDTNSSSKQSCLSDIDPTDVLGSLENSSENQSKKKSCNRAKSIALARNSVIENGEIPPLISKRKSPTAANATMPISQKTNSETEGRQTRCIKNMTSTPIESNSRDRSVLNWLGDVDKATTPENSSEADKENQENIQAKSPQLAQKKRSIMRSSARSEKESNCEEDVSFATPESTPRPRRKSAASALVDIRKQTQSRPKKRSRLSNAASEKQPDDTRTEEIQPEETQLVESQNKNVMDWLTYIRETTVPKAPEPDGESIGNMTENSSVLTGVIKYQSFNEGHQKEQNSAEEAIEDNQHNMDLNIDLDIEMEQAPVVTVTEKRSRKESISETTRFVGVIDTSVVMKMTRDCVE
ncbi:hypothetical protein DdX_10943 [Ditylenchus destructor]|uniref:Uncharacterized protein n=1 Tax=Ditylenchus destructor TaxID=166010 RepID=A0AAD4N3B6_9BILA|nr:hypothetical protein DdX_10943 [Ditylenchus destructor]